MISLLQRVRSTLSLGVVLLWWLFPCAPLLYGFFLPAGWLFPKWRRDLVSVFMKIVCWGSVTGFGLGGARFVRRGKLPTRDASLILMNHQSLLDIVTATLMGSPYAPAFVPRRRYSRWYVPLVGPTIGLLECPVVDPKRDVRGAVGSMRAAAVSQEHGLLVFPEGHRSTDGELRPFRTAGTEAILAARRLPVYLVVSDGFWFGRRLVDFVFNVHRIRGETEVLGPFAPPEAEQEIPQFIGRMRDLIASRLQEMRARRHAGA